MDQIEGYAGWIVAVLGGLTAAGVIGRWIVKRARRFGRRVNDMADTLLGREAIRHPDTGAVLAPATPSLGARLALMEETLVEMNNTQSELRDLSAQVRDLATQFETHEVASIEERKAMWRAIEAAVNAEPWDGTERRQQSD